MPWGSPVNPEGDLGPQPNKQSFPIAALRELAIIIYSTKLAALHYQLDNTGLNTRVSFINHRREKGLGADFLAEGAVMTYE